MENLLKQNTKKYNVVMVIGRFELFHIVYHQLITDALNLANKVIIILGSVMIAPDIENPFTPQFREKVIRASFSQEDHERMIFHGVRDYPYHENIWIAHLQNIVHMELENYYLNTFVKNEAVMSTTLADADQENLDAYAEHDPEYTKTDLGKSVFAAQIRCLL